MYSDKDSRKVTRQVAALTADYPSEVIFVDGFPYRGVAFYLQTEVELATLSPESAKADGIESVEEEMTDCESDSMWLVPKASMSQFDRLAKAYGRIGAVGVITADRSYRAYLAGPAASPAVAGLSLADR